MNSLANSLELSSRAQARVGPKIRRLLERNRSTMPSASGASGPTTVREIFSASANSASLSIAEIATFSKPASRAVPPLPGATKIFCTRGLWARRHPIACSLPPEPTTRIFMSSGQASMPEMPHACEHHGKSKLVRGRDHLVVAHASAGLDDGLRACSGDHFHAVAKREECVRRDDRSHEVQSRVLRLERGHTGGVDAAHLPCADAKRAAARAEHDGVRFDELRHAPREQQVGN